MNAGKDGPEITPYRLGVLSELAGKIIKMMVSSAWCISFEEMEIVLAMVRCGIRESKKGGNGNVS